MLSEVPSSVLHQEIYEQPAAIRRALTASAKPARDLAAVAKRRDVRYLVLAARGTSDNAATYAKYLMQIVCGVPVALAAPSVHTLYEATVDYREALVIGVSQSGAGEDVNEVVAQARKKGALTAAITNTPDSPLAATAEYMLLCNAGVERAVAATKTYTTTLAIFALLAAEWANSDPLRHSLAQIDAVAERTLETEESVEPLAQRLIAAQRIVTVARGLNLPTAIEASLKIAETTYTPTQAFSSADLLHGPIASVAAQTPCLLFAPNGKTVAGMADLARRLTERKAEVIRFAASALNGAEPDVRLSDPGNEMLSPIVDILPAQLLAYHLTVARGLNPDSPLGLTKVTITR